MPIPVTPANRKNYQSWGRYPKVKDALAEPLYWQGEIPDLNTFDRPVLAYGYGRSYGDCCQNNGGILLDTRGLRHFLAFDEEQGILRCEAGVSIAEILQIIVPRGWFVPVTPGTKFVSVGGAIANDIHGKNHHGAGTFGRYVTQFELLRSNGERLICSPTQNVEMYQATIGGLGLTGLILWAEFTLKKIANPFIAMERIKFGSLDEFFELNAESANSYEYTVSWLDCLIDGKHMGRGHYFRGDHATAEQGKGKTIHRNLKIPIPMDVPSFLLNTVTVRMFNEAVYRSQLPKKISRLEHYDPFFYPLDTFLNWNRCYGPQGFLQYQFVVPEQGAFKEILKVIRKAGAGSFLTVFKEFGDIKSPGMLSFPRPGITLAMDFPYRGEQTLKFLDKLDGIVRQNSGVIYPAKDGRMSAENFQAFYPNWKKFAQYIDPKFSSSLWRRVTANTSSQPVQQSQPVSSVPLEVGAH